MNALIPYQLKVCGLTEMKQILELISLNIDYLGFIFYPKSPRYALNKLTFDDIRHINHRGKVGVFVNEPINNLLFTASQCHLNFIQLHGDESVDNLRTLREKLSEDIKIIKAFRIPAKNNDDDSLKALRESILLYQDHIDYVILDTDSKNYGGTGETFDWQIINYLNLQKPFFLSGGISFAHHNELLSLNTMPKPYALDINSKFEISPGIKDLDQIKTFIKLLNNQ